MFCRSSAFPCPPFCTFVLCVAARGAPAKTYRLCDAHTAGNSLFPHIQPMLMHQTNSQLRFIPH